MPAKLSKSVLVIVAHPDDETLWAGGTILSHPKWTFFVIALSRITDADRAPRFRNALKILKSEGVMNDMDDGPFQEPLDEKELEEIILRSLPQEKFDLLITHNPSGEYTRHLRHEEVSKAVINLWNSGKIPASELWTFAYSDEMKKHYPKAEETATIYNILSSRIWNQKYRIITETYGFEKNSWEAQTTPKAEAFWQFKNSVDAILWLKNGGIV